MKGVHKRKVLVTLIFIILLIFSSFLNLAADTYNSSSAAFTDVESAIQKAGYGDTVIVPAGSATWNETLYITKVVKLQGDEGGKTIITAGAGVGDSGLINYKPDAYSQTSDDIFQVTGFEFRGDGKKIIIPNNPTSQYVNKIRINHNTFDGVSYGIRFSGYIEGLVDNNIFKNVSIHEVYVLGSNNTSWDNLSSEPGSVNAVYIEDNTFTTSACFVGGGHGGAYVFRYNTVSITGISWPFLDAHGNQAQGDNATAIRGMRFVEVYENEIEGITQNIRFLDQRGGKLRFFNNNFSGSSGMPNVRLREEDGPDAYNSAPSTVSHGGQYYICTANHTSSANTEPGVGASWGDYWNICGDCPRYSNYGGSQITSPWEKNKKYVYSPGYDPVIETYLWNNTFGQEQVEAYTNDSFYIIENRDFWNYKNDFNGNSGVGSGTISERPATGAEGVGFWDEDQRILYKMESNSWVEYYSPYSYPHPLRNGESSGSPKPTNIRVYD